MGTSPLPIAAILIGVAIALVLGVLVGTIILQYNAQKHDQQYVVLPRKVVIKHNGRAYETIVDPAYSRVTVNDDRGERLFLLDWAKGMKTSWAVASYQEEDMDKFLLAILPKIVNHFGRSPL